MSAYHTSSNSAPSQRHAADERASAPHLPVMNASIQFHLFLLFLCI
jgi:hypothetical protein